MSTNTMAPALGHWTADELQRFLEIRQEFFLDPMGSNKERFVEAAIVLQRALFDWYLSSPGKFEGMLALVKATAATWSELRKEERRTLSLRRFALNSAVPEIPSVESSVPEHQWQKILGSLGLGLSDPGTFDRFLVQLDDATNPSLRINHRYLGELLPHDNMISYLSSMTATFLNENAIIGKASPCVTHMEQAAIKWLLTLVGWDGEIRMEKGARITPVPRLPALAPLSERFARWEREEPTGAIVAGGSIANISALLIARSAVFDYLLGWSGAVQWLGPTLAWQLIRKIYRKRHLVVLTSKGTHYSISKAALQAGVGLGNVVEVAGCENPWILDGCALAKQLAEVGKDTLILAVAAIAGKTETGYVDKLEEIAKVLNRGDHCLDRLPEVRAKLLAKTALFEAAIATLRDKKKAREAFAAVKERWEYPDEDFEKLLDRAGTLEQNEVQNAHHNRLFLHVDAAHGGGYLAIPELRQSVLRGIALADTITIDGHKSFYCYYPCGGLLVRATRWAQTFSTGHSAYISEEENRGAYREGLLFAQTLASKESRRQLTVGRELDRDAEYVDDVRFAIDQRELDRLDAVYRLARRPMAQDRSELTHQPFIQYLEGSRGPQGIMQLYFNLATLGLSGYKSILAWTALLRARAEEAISLGMSDLRLVTHEPLRTEKLRPTDKLPAILSAGSARCGFEELRTEPTAVVPISGGRFLRLSAGSCNQLLVTYTPVREAKLIATADQDYWKKRGVAEIHRVMRYLWRVNEHLWNDHIYANPHFTYYLGHTDLELILPWMGKYGDKTAKEREEERQRAVVQLATLLTEWNAWTRQDEGVNPFLGVLAEYVAEAIEAERAKEERVKKPAKKQQGSGDDRPEGTTPKKEEERLHSYARKFFCHKIVVMHPYTDESLLGDVLRRLAFWGERSVLDVRVADATAQFLFPDKPDKA